MAPPYTTLADWSNVLRRWNFHTVRTGALAETATSSFVEHGFTCVQRLALLRFVLDRSVELELPRHELRTIRGPRQLAVAARIDSVAFENGWELDVDAILDACRATPHHRIRLAVTATDQPAGYVITGRNGTAGFVQRLAVVPEFEGQGIATSLLLDGLRWLQRRHVREVLVNTNFDNDRALELYERFGFSLVPESLQVFEKSLATDHSPPEDV